MGLLILRSQPGTLKNVHCADLSTQHSKLASLPQLRDSSGGKIKAVFGEQRNKYV